VQLPAPLITIHPAPMEYAVHKMIHRDGYAKGLVGVGDHLISVRGHAYGKNGTWPEAQVKELQLVSSRTEAMDIENVLTSYFLKAPQQVVLYGKPIIEPVPGYQGMVRYQFEFLSDTPFTLIVTPK
jgi:hypothetical protein